MKTLFGVTVLLLSVLSTTGNEVTVLTTASFESEVRDSGKNAIVKFYAPWVSNVCFTSVNNSTVRTL